MTWFGVDYIFSLIFGVLFFVLCLALWLLLLLFLLCVCPFHFLIFIYGLSGYWFENILKFVCAEKSVNLDCFDCYLSPYLLDSCRSLCDCCNIDRCTIVVDVVGCKKDNTRTSTITSKFAINALCQWKSFSLWVLFYFLLFCRVFHEMIILPKKKIERTLHLHRHSIQFNSILKCTLMFVSEFFFCRRIFPEFDQPKCSWGCWNLLDLGFSLQFVQFMTNRRETKFDSQNRHNFTTYNNNNKNTKKETPYK